ncbi:hypothetical protein V496_01974 [Pseudogymnoascus sp. VKM F-4515 (FW-2607)]|nr:hypothetical protein V496_01974 [Pseudogymnoascus sp. VKM F-4515 (FW-2607)]
MRFQIYLDMSAKTLEAGIKVVGANDRDLPPEWQSCLDLNIQLDRVTELKPLIDDRTVGIQHRHPSRLHSSYQEPQMKRSTVKMVFENAEDAVHFIRLVKNAEDALQYATHGMTLAYLVFCGQKALKTRKTAGKSAMARLILQYRYSDHLATPAKSAESERVRSAGGDNITKKRNRLAPSALRYLRNWGVISAGENSEEDADA